MTIFLSTRMMKLETMGGINSLIFRNVPIKVNHIHNTRTKQHSVTHVGNQKYNLSL
jgi:hypothetical protein